MKDQIELMKRIAGMLHAALEENITKTIGQAVELIANELIEDAEDMEKYENNC